MKKMKQYGVPMYLIREVSKLILTTQLGDKEIADRFDISNHTVCKYRSRINKVKLSKTHLETLEDVQLEELLKLKPGKKRDPNRPLPDFEYITKELRRKGVTKQLLWEEYIQAHPNGYKRAYFIKLYNDWAKLQDTTLLQSFKPGELCFIDYSGLTMKISNPSDGTKSDAEIFVGVLGASNYTFVEATKDQSLISWIQSHVNMFQYFGGVPAVLVPDNLKSAVTTPSKYDPKINRTYTEMCFHYQTRVLPARVKKPQDKSKAENGVLQIQRRILAPLRNRTFFSLEELNEAIAHLLITYNQRPHSHKKRSREELFEKEEKSQLKPLPESAYEQAEWSIARVPKNYHLGVYDHFYSVPYGYIQKQVEIRSTQQKVEVFYKSKKIASHKRDDRPFEKTTCSEHMPESHRRYLDWQPEEFLQKAKDGGQHVLQVIEKIIQEQHPSQYVYRQCNGILSLLSLYPKARVDQACRRALHYGSISYNSLKSILETRLDESPLPNRETKLEPVSHDNIRGAEYFQQLQNSKRGEFLC